jgi:hypothetical protein
MTVSRPMRFWELVSVFGARRDLFRQFLAKPEWSTTYSSLFDRFDDLVRQQDRSALDTPVPVAMSRALAHVDGRSWFLDTNGWLRAVATGSLNDRVLTTLEVHDAFGGGALEEVLERGSFNTAV